MIGHAQEEAAIAAKRAHGLGHAGEPRIAKTVLLREHRDLLRFQAAHFNEIANDGFGLLRVAGAIIEDIAVRRIPPQHGSARVPGVKKHLMFERERSGDRGRGRAEIADKAENLLLFVKLLHGIDGARRFIAVVGYDEAQHAAVNAARVVGLPECCLDADLDLMAVVLVRAGERHGSAKADFGIAHAPHQSARDLSGEGGGLLRRGRSHHRGLRRWRRR